MCLIDISSLSQQIRIWWHANQLIISKHQQRFPEPSKWSLSLVHYTIMRKTADLTVVQKTIIDTLHKERKPQTFIAKEAVHRVLYPSMLTESWVKEKDAQPTERSAALWGLSSKINSRIWVKFTRNGLSLGSRHQEHHTQTCRGIWLQLSSELRIPGLRRRRTGLLPSGPKSSFKKRASFVFHLETKVLESGGRVEKLILLKLLQSVCQRWKEYKNIVLK